MTDLVPHEERARGFGIVSAAIGVGAAIGPSTVGYFGSNNFFIGLGIGLASVVVTLFFMCFLRESLHFRKHQNDDTVVEKEDSAFKCSLFFNPFRTLGVIFTSKNMYLTGLSIIFILYSTAVTDLTSTFVLFVSYRYSFDLLKVGLCDSLLGVLMCINQGLLLQHYEKVAGLRKMLVCGFIISTFSHLSYAFAFKWELFIAAMGLSSLGFVGHPTIQTLITNAVDPAKRGEVLGALGAIQAICILIGGVINDNLFAYFISGKAFINFSGPQFIFGSFLFTVAVIFATILFTKFKGKCDLPVTTISIQTADSDTKPLLNDIEN